MTFGFARRVAVLAAAALLTTTLTQSAEASLGTWRVELLPSPAGYPGATGWVRGTDSHGGFAGNLVLDGASQVVTWSGTQATVHPLPAGLQSPAVADENSAGTVLGDVADASFQRQVFLLEAGKFRLLPRPADRPYVSAAAINERGDVVATASGWSAEDPEVLLWRAEDREHPVVITGGPYLSATDVDDDGSVLADSFPGAVLWKDGTFTRLTAPPGAGSVHAAAVRTGQVVGNFATADQTPGGVQWRTPADPVVLPGSGAAFGVNRTGLVVGYGDVSTGRFSPLRVWLGTQPYGTLPPAPGFAAAWAEVVGDDGVVAGTVANSEPTTNTGRPAVWRYSLR
ncbi:hypothetical protein OG439_43475 [Amycolatopsis sp. NBC_01307]|uniref:hypothetical protein n=1 Tax=Amycolatopsis sp. NBC_01307 TaxID=2903561 RepID=UPI002E14A815|nr:hypothetical protein OG439_43475 [Amycolatopsis sp. NBC_01307]